MNATTPVQQQAGSLRGVVTDQDFDAPLPGAQVTIVDTGQRTNTTDQGNFVFPEVTPGTYTLVFSKDGYVRQVRTDVIVSPGRLTDANASLVAEYYEMEEFVVQDVLSLGGGTEEALLQLRFESPALMDSISADLMSRAGAGDAASALRLVSGATVQDGKTAVIRGLPDRYVSSQLNGVRLPSADADKRAVELDQFPAAVIESVQVSKTFTPDQQGDASGGAVDVRLKSIPEEPIFEIKSQIGFNTNVTNREDFRTYDGGGVSTFGRDRRPPQPIPDEVLGANWEGAVGTTTGKSPTDYKFSLSLGGSHDLDRDFRIGAFANFFYERDSEFYDDGQEDFWWVESPGAPLTPEVQQGSVEDGDFITQLFDIQQGTQIVQFGGLGTLGLETQNHSLTLTYLFSRTTEDQATLSTDTRGKEYFFPGYDRFDLNDEGNDPDNLRAAPYIRGDAIVYTERETGSLQLNGEHTLEGFEFLWGPLANPRRERFFKPLAPEFDWTISRSYADSNQPDKRQFAALWTPRSEDPGTPGLIDPFIIPPRWLPFKPSATFTLGNLQRIWTVIEEDSEQLTLNFKMPFEQWSGDQGYFKAGYFDDEVVRTFDQDNFSNFDDNSNAEDVEFENPWSDFFALEDHPIKPSFFDVDYRATQKISAWYAMADIPFSSFLNVIGGVRVETSRIDIVNDPEQFATWFPPDEDGAITLLPGEADVDFQERERLPSIAVVLQPLDRVTVRGSFAKTIARQTFKELTPILQSEFVGGPIFIGNPELVQSKVKNYDLRVDYEPYPGGLFSVSWFKKDIKDPIEYVQRFRSFNFTTPLNYPSGELEGFEFELRQNLGNVWEPLQGLSFGANATFIDSEVRLTQGEIDDFADPAVNLDFTKRDMTATPEHLYNFFITYDYAKTGTEVGLFYTVQGDTLVSGATLATFNFVPNIYAKEFTTLNLTVTQRLGQYFNLKFQARNLTDPDIDLVYRSPFTGPDVLRSRSNRGVDYSLSLGAQFRF